MGLRLKFILLYGLCLWLGGQALGLTLTSPAFTDVGELPVAYTEAESEISPPLAWSGADRQTFCYVLIVDEPRESGPSIIHWVVYNIPVSLSGLDESFVPESTHSLRGPCGGLNDWAKMSWVGLQGENAALRFRLYALKRPLRFDETPNAAAIYVAMDGLVVDFAQLQSMPTE